MRTWHRTLDRSFSIQQALVKRVDLLHPEVVKAFSMPLNYPAKHRYYFFDESSFTTGEFMAIAGLVVLARRMG